MSLNSGSQIGPYTIEREIGRGGMGVVYLGRDTRLDRAVAIKSLPEHLANEPERLARFEREAKVLATLSHPNVAGIYGVEEVDGARYLILEYVEGETLADRLDRGALPVDEAIELAVQIAAGVEAAHEAGVIHRDLKPANIKITPAGDVKVLDFGLARADEGASTSSSTSQLQTRTSPAIQNSPTMPGVILGTAAYMSPEQARGRKVDKRTDIWSFGVILYEMLAGAGPFVGETVSDSIGAILHKEIDIRRLDTNTPPHVVRVVSRCLERDKNMRYRDIGDASLDLTNPVLAGSAEVTAPTRRGFIGIALALLFGVVVGFIAFSGRQEGPSAEPLRFVLPMHEGSVQEYSEYSSSRFDVSHQRGEVLFVGQESNARGESVSAIYVRSLHDAGLRKIPGTEHARGFNVSPDGQGVVFMWDDPDSTDEELRRVRIAGGPVESLISSDAAGGYVLDGPIFWRTPGSILVLGNDRLKLFEYIFESSTTRELADIADVIPDAIFVVLEGFTNNGETLFLGAGQADPIRGPTVSLFVYSVSERESKLLLPNAHRSTLFGDGTRLAFDRDRTLSVVRFDPDSLEVRGEAVPVVSNIDDYEISPEGHLYYTLRDVNRSSGAVERLRFDGTREVLATIPTRLDTAISFSPDFQSVSIITRETGAPEAELLDLQTGFRTVVLDSPTPTSGAVWIDDEEVAFLYFSSYGQIKYQRIRMGIETVGTDIAPMGEESGVQVRPDITSDASWMAYQYASGFNDPNSDIYIVNLEGEPEPRPLIATSNGEGSVQFAPNDRWIAYIANVANERRVFVQGFDPAEGRLTTRVIPVSSQSGINPRWSPEGRYLYFADLVDDELKRVEITYEPEFSIGPEQTVFTEDQIDGFRMSEASSYDVLPNDEGIVYTTSPPVQKADPYIYVIQNWEQEIEQLLAPDSP